MAVARWKLALSASALGTSIALIGAELWARQQPPERLQRVTADTKSELKNLDGVPVWKQDPKTSALRWNLDCFEARPDAPRIAIVGSSIFYGVELTQEQTLGPLLAARLTEPLGEEPCVTNLSEAGFTFQAEWARARAELPAIEPDVLIWEIWTNAPFEYTWLGEDAYNFGHLALDAAGYPNPFGLSPELNLTLLEASGLYRMLVFGSTERASPNTKIFWEDFASEEITMLADWADAQDIELILVFCPSLSTDFATTATQSERTYGHVERLGEARGLPMVYLARDFADLDPVDLRLDTCCHFNSTGMAAVADQVAAAAGALLE